MVIPARPRGPRAVSAAEFAGRVRRACAAYAYFLTRWQHYERADPGAL